MRKWWRNFKCYTMGWHCEMGSQRWHDGASMHAVCSHCEAHCMQDGQGNWFGDPKKER